MVLGIPALLHCPSTLKQTIHGHSSKRLGSDSAYLDLQSAQNDGPVSHNRRVLAVGGPWFGVLLPILSVLGYGAIILGILEVQVLVIRIESALQEF